MNLYIEEFVLSKHFSLIQNKLNTFNSIELNIIYKSIEDYFKNNVLFINQEKENHSSWFTTFNLFYLDNFKIINSYLFFLINNFNAKEIIINNQNNNKVNKFLENIFINNYFLKKIIIYKEKDKININRLIKISRIFNFTVINTDNTKNKSYNLINKFKKLKQIFNFQ